MKKPRRAGGALGHKMEMSIGRPRRVRIIIVTINTILKLFSDSSSIRISPFLFYYTTLQTKVK